jgi:L-asparaginase II
MSDVHPVLAQVVRSGFVEGEHRGSVVVLDVDGEISYAAGDVDAAMFPRSSNKPLQAVGMVHLGLDLPDKLLALVTASHSGETVHFDGVAAILDTAGLDVTALQTPESEPLGELALRQWIGDHMVPQRIASNCSGKHAGMIVTAALNGWDVATYRDLDHPLQRSLRRTFESLTGTPVEAVGIDGCGAPVLSTSLRALAGAFQRLVLADPSSAERRVADAMRIFPWMVGGNEGRDVTDHMLKINGLVMKDGAEGVVAAALADGRAFALKVDDGAPRAREVVTVAILRSLGCSGTSLDRYGETVLLGGGQPVGAVRAVVP